MSTQTKFQEDLRVGKKIEHEVCDRIKKKYPKAFVVEGYQSGYDIVIPEMRVEVKYDMMSEKTGNYLIEVEQDGKPSGLATSTADWWVLVDKEYLTWVNAESLRYFLKDYKLLTLTPKGDTRQKKAYLVPIVKLRVSPFVVVQKRT